MLVKSALLALLTIATYLPAINAPFVYDDAHFVITNDVVVRGHWNWSTPRLLTLLSYRANYRTTGDRPMPFHIVNLALHLLNGFLVFHLARSVFGFDSDWSLFTAAAILLNPLSSEAVIYISGRSELLAATFIFASVLAFHRQW